MEITSFTRPPRFFHKLYSQSVWCSLTSSPLFTFDDGPGEMTDKILDLGDKYNEKFVFLNRVLNCLIESRCKNPDFLIF